MRSDSSTLLARPRRWPMIYAMIVFVVFECFRNPPTRRSWKALFALASTTNVLSGVSREISKWRSLLLLRSEAESFPPFLPVATSAYFLKKTLSWSSHPETDKLQLVVLPNTPMFLNDTHSSSPHLEYPMHWTDYIVTIRARLLLSFFLDKSVIISALCIVLENRDKNISNLRYRKIS